MVPAGVAHGYEDRTPGAGLPGEHGGEPGDRVIAVHIVQAQLERGEDWFGWVSLTQSQAAAGGAFPVEVNGVTRRAPIPGGVRADRPLAMPGLGGPGKHGGPPGTLHLTLEIRPDPERGRDLHLSLDLTPHQARRGGTFLVPHEGAMIAVTVPKQSRDGETITEKGTGCPGRHGGAPGDRVVQLQVREPAPHPARIRPPRALPRTPIVVGAIFLAGALGLGPLRSALQPPGNIPAVRITTPGSPRSRPAPPNPFPAIKPPPQQTPPPKAPPLKILTRALPLATSGAAYAARLEASVSRARWSWEPSAGQRGGSPAGLTLTPDGVLQGTPRRSGHHRFAVRAEDGPGRRTTAEFSLEARASLAVRQQVERAREDLTAYERAARDVRSVSPAQRTRLERQLRRAERTAAAAAKQDPGYVDAYLVWARILYSLEGTPGVPHWGAINQQAEQTTGDPAFAAQRGQFEVKK